MPLVTSIEVTAASTHNLKSVSCRFPHQRLTVVTGLSGSGKSSLVFDTLFAEARRRFVESMSTYARQFLDRVERPPVETIENLLPAVAVEARNSILNARSTVGTCTETHDLLRLLFSHLGTPHCPQGHGAVEATTPQEVAEFLLENQPVGTNFTILASLPRPRRGANIKLAELVRQGFFRRWESGRVERLVSTSRWLKVLDPLVLALGRFTAGQPSSRLASTIEDAFQLTGGSARSVGDDGVCRFFGRRLTCGTCGTIVPQPTPALFSFNSPLGACRTCRGFGRVMGLDRQRTVPDPSKTLAERPFAPWNSPAYRRLYSRMLSFCRRQGIPLDVPFSDLSEEHRELLFSGGGGFTSLERWFARLGRKSYRVQVRVLLARYRAYTTCPDCEGTRLRPEARAVLFDGTTLAALTQQTIAELLGWVKERNRTQRLRRRADRKGGDLLERLQERLDTLAKVGLGYLSLDRQARTLSGGETQRVQLATALGSGLTSTLYVLDEPTIGLHPRDSGRLLQLLRELTARGNTLVVVEHDPAIIRGADHIIDLGPLAGEHGGEILAEGDLDAILATESSLTAHYLAKSLPGRPLTKSREHHARYRREHPHLQSLAAEIARRPRISILGATANNLDSIDVDIPLGSVVAVTGVSGSGKSSLVQNVLYRSYRRSRGDRGDADEGECEALVGMDQLSDLILVDQRLLGRSSRSNPVTYIRAYDTLRKLFATAAATQGKTSITPGHFSFNTDKGRCPECKGTGQVEIDMHFMAPVRTFCDACQGRRFVADVLAIRCRGLTITETLKLTVSEALARFADQRSLARKLLILAEVGLGYIRLGQPTSTLSGGEAQRLKLASFLDQPKKSESPKLYLFDEPTTGLHLADIDLLHQSLKRLVANGDSVVVVEHSPDLIARSEWIVDLGPGGGNQGGKLLFCGPTEDFLDRCESPTAAELRAHIGISRPRLANG